MSGNHSDLSWDEAMGLTSRDVLSRRPRRAAPLLPRIPLGPSLWPTKHEPVREGWLRWSRTVTDQHTGDVLKVCRAPFRWLVWHLADRAAHRIHEDRERARRAEA